MRRRQAVAIPAHMLVPGYFTALMRQHNWPPGFTPSTDAANKMPAQFGLTPAERERRAELGIGWGNGTMVMANSPKHRAPGWLKT